MGKCCEGKISPHSIVIEIRGHNGPNLKREHDAPQCKLNNVCDADNRPAKDAQRAMIILIYHNMLWMSIWQIQYTRIIGTFPLQRRNLIRINYAFNTHKRRTAAVMRIICV